MALHRRSHVVLLALAATYFSAAMAHAERHLYVANYGTNKLTIYDYIHGSVVRQLADLDVCHHPHALAVQPAGSNAYLSCEDGEVWSINALGLSASPIVVGTGFARDMAAESNGSWLWIAELHPGVVTRLNTGNGNEQDIVAPLRPDGSAPGAPRHIALGEGGTKVYVASSDGVLWRIDIATMTVEYLHDFGTAIGDLVMSMDGRDVFLTGPQNFLFYWIHLSMCSAQQCNPDDIMLANSPRSIVIDPDLSLGGPWISFPMNNSVRPFTNLNYSFNIDNPAGLALDEDFYSFLAASPATDQICPFHFAAGPYTCIQQAIGSQPVAVAFGPENNVIRATPGSWRFVYSELRDTLPRTLELKNVSKEIVRIGALELVGENKDSFSVNAGGCVGTTLKPYASCKITAFCKPRKQGSIYKAGIYLHNTASTGTKQLALVCAPAVKK